ncbi:MAG: T9SS type A sorting domain-containing protein [candidate division Zixibacteria bacterium]|nr:T9SS type A sorting domain-containing protein [candidate division Zixibacteria bacterium]
MRKMFPYGLGTRIYMEEEGEVVEHTEPIICAEQLVEENCEIVVFVQAYATRDILQAAKIKLTDFPTSIEEDGKLPTSFSLDQNYPNPFNAGTEIRYSTTEEGQVELAIYDLLGQKIRNLVNGNQQPGNHQVLWDGSDSDGRTVSSGVYFYRLTSNSQSISKRMVLMK